MYVPILVYTYNFPRFYPAVSVENQQDSSSLPHYKGNIIYYIIFNPKLYRKKLYKRYIIRI